MSNRMNNELFQIKDLLSEAASFLDGAGIESARLEAQVLLAHLLEWDRTRLLINDEETVDPAMIRRYRELIDRRTQGEPLQYLTGHQEFMGMDFGVCPGVLIPRDDTTVLVEAVLEEAAVHPGWQTLADVGTGSGAIGVALKRALPQVTVYGSDVSPVALDQARENATALGAEIIFLESDLLAEYRNRGIHLDAVVSNPPYIRSGELCCLPANVRQEPVQALDGGPDGLDYYRRLAGQAREVLRSGGLLAVEIGWDQGQVVAEIFGQTGYNGCRVRPDWGGRDRVVLGWWGEACGNKNNPNMD